MWRIYDHVVILVTSIPPPTPAPKKTYFQQYIRRLIEVYWTTPPTVNGLQYANPPCFVFVSSSTYSIALQNSVLSMHSGWRSVWFILCPRQFSRLWQECRGGNGQRAPHSLSFLVGRLAAFKAWTAFKHDRERIRYIDGQEVGKAKKYGYMPSIKWLRTDKDKQKMAQFPRFSSIKNLKMLL